MAYFYQLKYNSVDKSTSKVKYEFGKIYKEGTGFSENADLGSGTAIFFYDNNSKTVKTESKTVTRIPKTGEKGVLSIKSIQYFDEVTFNASGELTAYDPDSIILFTHYKSLESEYTSENGKSVVFPASFKVNYRENLDRGITINGDKEAEYIDFWYSSDSGVSHSDEYRHKIRDTYDLSSRSQLSNEKNVSGNFDSGWWGSISFGEESNNSLSRLISASTWSESIAVNRELTGTANSGVLQAKQIEKNSWTGPTGSVITGSSSNDIIRGLAGWDILDGGNGDDLIHGGNGRDIIDGGSGSDELHGDFGWNTYKEERDGSIDLIAIKSDQKLSNWWYGKAGNNSDGRKADIIEGLDPIDQIKIIGVAKSDLSFKESVSHKGVTGVGIYANGILEALYTGGDLSAQQISVMTTGDDSAQAISNQVWSYWGDNTVPPLLP